MVERGVVAKLKSKGKFAVVEFDRHAACDSCHMCAVTPKGKVSVTLPNTLNAQVGDFVEVQMSERIVLTAAFLVYFVPLVLASIGLGLGFIYNVWLALGLALGGVVIGFVITYLLDKFVVRKNEKYTPVMTRLMTEQEVIAAKEEEKRLLEAANIGIKKKQETKQTSKYDYPEESYGLDEDKDLDENEFYDTVEDEEEF